MPVRETLKAPGGVLYLVRGLKLIFSDFAILRLALAPALVNIVLFGVLFMSFNYFAYEISAYVFDQSSQAWYWYAISTMVGILLFLASILVVLFGFVAIGLIVAAPFNDMLASAIERKVTGNVAEVKMSLLKLAGHTMKNEAKKMSIIITVQLALLLVNLVPGIGQAIFLIASPCFMALVMTYEFTGYTLDRRGLSFAQKRAYLKSHLGRSMGFGLAVAATVLIPLLNFMLLPLAVAGGTLMVIENPPEEEFAVND